VIKFVSDLRQVNGFHRVLWFPPPIKLTATLGCTIFWYLALLSMGMCFFQLHYGKKIIIFDEMMMTSFFLPDQNVDLDFCKC
jgi:hypothetical protein